MNLANLFELNAGGVGSGCNPAAGTCGRPAGSGATPAAYRRGSTIDQIFRRLDSFNGSPVSMQTLRNEFGQSANIANRISAIAGHGRESGAWQIIRNPRTDTVTLVRPNRAPATTVSRPVTLPPPLQRATPVPQIIPPRDMTERFGAGIPPNAPFRKAIGSLKDYTAGDGVRVTSTVSELEFKTKFGMTPAAYATKVMEGTGVDLSHVTVKIMTTGSTRYRVQINGPTFEQTRNFDFGTKIVDHSYWQVNSGAQGKGLGKTMFNNLVDIYDHLGFEAITVHANLDVGGYAWARYGFTPREANWNSIRESAKRTLDGSNADPATVTMARVALANPDPRGIWLLANLDQPSGRRDGETIGQRLLKGTDWNGSIKLHDEGQYSVLRAYIGSKPKTHIRGSADDVEFTIVNGKKTNAPIHTELLDNPLGANASSWLAIGTAADVFKCKLKDAVKTLATAKVSKEFAENIRASEEVTASTSEAANRNTARSLAYYAESGPTYDPAGKYLCGTCKFRTGDDQCQMVEGPINFKIGSCMLFTLGAPAAAVHIPAKMSQTDVVYTERPHVKAFGCTRCDYGKETAPDSAGRTVDCSFWQMHAKATACCMENKGKDDVIAPADNKVHAGGQGSGCNPAVGQCGRPATGEQYHGTSVKAIQSIMKKGILPTDATLGYKAAFATNSKDLAFSYAVGAAARAGKLKGAVVAIAVIKEPSKAGMTMVEGKNNLAIAKGGIRPEFIDRVEIYNWDAKKGDAPVKVIRASLASPDKKAYIVLQFDSAGIDAGGPGSGCNPSAGHCGRPRTGASKKTSSKDPLTTFRNPRTAGRAARRAEKAAKKAARQAGVRPARVDKSLKTHQQPSRQAQQPFASQEKVILKEDIYRGSKRSRAGEEAIVVNVLPKVTNQPQIYSVRLRNGHTEYLTQDQLARPVVAGPQAAKPALTPLGGSRVKQSFVNPDGSRFTEFFPSLKGMDEGKTGQRDPFSVAHSLKGSFTRLTDDVYVKGAENRITTIFSAPSKSGVEGAGTTVFVHRYPSENRVNVQEVRTGAYAWQSSLLRQYNFEGRQAQTKAMTFTKTRYGFSLKLPKMRF